MQEAFLPRHGEGHDQRAGYGYLRCVLRGRLQFEALQAAWLQVVSLHPVLRTSFAWKRVERPLQIVWRSAASGANYRDLRGLSSAEQDKSVRGFLESDSRKGFDPSIPLLARLSIIRKSSEVHYLILSYHQLILDEASLFLVLNRLLVCYEAALNKQKVKLDRDRPYRDFIAWIKQQDQSGAETFWRDELAGFTSPTSVAPQSVKGQPNLIVEEYSDQRANLSAETSRQLRLIARNYGFSVNSIIQTAWAILLNRYSRERDVLFGVTVGGRPATLDGAESIIGRFKTVLPVRVNATCEAPVSSLIKEIEESNSKLRQFQYCSPVRIQRCSEAPDYLMLVGSVVSVYDRGIEDSFKKRSQLVVTDIELFEEKHIPLELIAVTEPEISLRLNYDCRRYDGLTISRMSGHLKTLLEEIATNPQRRFCELAMLTASERRQLTVQWNATATRRPINMTLHELIELQVKRTPDSAALVFEDQLLTYRELNLRANRLAHSLREIGAGPETIVAICMRRSVEMVVGLLGILKAGAAYLPLDPAYPVERLAFMLTDSRPVALLAQESLAVTNMDLPTRVLRIDAQEREQIVGSEENPASGVAPANLAYVIYTSGSTGKPKAAMNSHRAICNRLLWMQDAFHLTSEDSVLQKTPFTFDVSVWEFFWPLLSGARLVVAEPMGHQDNSYLVDIITRQKISTVHFVPSMLRLFLEQERLDSCSSLKRVVASGEALSHELQKKFFARLGAELYNLYGPTEAAVDVTFWQCQRRAGTQRVPIGRPIANTNIYVLDPFMHPAPIGVAGELHIGGVAVGRAYLNRPDLTAERFIPDPFAEGARLYETGDLAGYREDGAIEFFGRIDHQVKLRGFRIELAEIEAAISKHRAVREAITVVREEPTGDKQIVAYVVARTGQAPTVAELRGHLKEKLPDYMIPSRFVMLDALPLTRSGKVDRAALPAPDQSRQGLDEIYVAPRNATERRLAAIWSQLLGVDRVGINDNFFELGGHSLMIGQVVARIREAYEVELKLSALFEAATVGGLAAVIEQEKEKQADSGVSRIQARPRGNKSLPDLLAKLGQISEQQEKQTIKLKGVFTSQENRK
ncbi:MAG: non-ribosomal peptide synthetase [Blastocatellia bacterium]